MEIGEVGEMHLAGPTTSPGYVSPEDRGVSLEFYGAFVVLHSTVLGRGGPDLTTDSCSCPAGMFSGVLWHSASCTLRNRHWWRHQSKCCLRSFHKASLASRYRALYIAFHFCQ